MHHWLLVLLAFCWSINSSGHAQQSDQNRLLLSPVSNNSTTANLRVMTFNTWQAGGNVDDGIRKIIKHIQANDPDVVALQEMEWWAINELRQALGWGWMACPNPIHAGTVIFTRKLISRFFQPMNHTQPLHVGCQVEITQYPYRKLINLWNIHLFWGYYGPYAACQKSLVDEYQLRLCEYAGQLQYEVAIDGNPQSAPQESEKVGRLNEIQNLLRHDAFRESIANDDVATLLMGDLNSPSHLDWVERTRRLHCNWTFEWPVTKMLHDHGFIDSYRQLHQDPLLHSGHTWSPIVKYKPEWEGIFLVEPQDRIDYIFYKGNSIHPVTSRTYHGNQVVSWSPKHAQNDWPSDHSSVITDFVITF